MSYRAWRKELLEVVKHSLNHALAPFLPLFQEEASGEELLVPEYQLRFDWSNTQGALTGTSTFCPPVDELLNRYLAVLMESGFLDPPPAGSQQTRVGTPSITSYHNRKGLPPLL
nr:thioester-redct: thioester reductase [uncultured bacterium]